MINKTFTVLAVAGVSLIFTSAKSAAGYIDITVNDGSPNAGSYTVLDGPAEHNQSYDPR